MPFRSWCHVLWRQRVSLTLLVTCAAVASFALSLQFPPLSAATVEIEVTAEVGSLLPELVRPGLPVPSVAALERAYYAGLDVPKGWLHAERVVKQLEAGYGWQVQAQYHVLTKELQDSLSATKQGQRGLRMYIRNYSPWRTQQFAAALRDVLSDDGGRWFAGGPAVRSVQVTVLEAPGTVQAVQAPSVPRRVLALLQQGTMAVATTLGVALVLQALIGIVRTSCTTSPALPRRRSSRRRSSSAPA